MGLSIVHCSEFRLFVIANSKSEANPASNTKENGAKKKKVKLNDNIIERVI